MQNIEAIINELVSVLKIKKRPVINFLAQNLMPTATMMAAISNDGEELVLSQNLKKENYATIWLVLSHEMRHAWQIEKGIFLESEYVQRSASASVVDYNSQKLEVDAWAFASIMVEEKFGFKPKLNKFFNEEIIELIDMQILELKRFF